MSIVQVRHIRAALTRDFSDVVDMSDYSEKTSSQRESAFLSRGLAAYALQTLTEMEPVEAANCITDGSGDNGIDAVYVDTEANRLIVVQSKWINSGNGSVSAGDIHKFVQGFNDILNEKYDRFNAKFQPHVPAIQLALEDVNVGFLLLVVHSGVQDLGETPKRALDDLLAHVNDSSDAVDYRVIRQADLHRSISGELEGSRITLDVAMESWGSIDEPYKAYYGRVEVAQVAAWHETHGQTLFASNLRQLLPDSEVNDSIVRTLIGQPDHFWYLNNGITVICDSVKMRTAKSTNRRYGEVVCEGASVVNGAQTVGCIGIAHTQDPEGISSASVMVRFISLTDAPDGFATDVTRGTNTQNRVERRDFVALHTLQRNIKNSFELELGKVYSYRRGEIEPQGDEGCGVRDATLALACLNEDVSMAVQAKREIGLLWENTERPPYTTLFNDSVPVLRIWRAVQAMRVSDDELKRQQGVRTGRQRGVAVHGNRLTQRLLFEVLDSPELERIEDWNDSVLPMLANWTVEVLDRLTAIVEENYSSNYLASLFKNAARCRDIAASFSGTSTLP